jgi:protein TonB
MYGTQREHARGPSQALGISTAVLLTLAVGAGLGNGFAGDVVRVIATPIIFTPSVKDEPQLSPSQKIDLSIDADTPLPIPKLLAPGETFEAEESETPLGARDSLEGAGTIPIGPGTAKRKAVAPTHPVMQVQPPPPYPASEVRKQHQGITTIEVCVDSRGQVTDANLASTSGYTALDAAALKWVRSVRFTPGKAGGVPVAVCGHGVIYEWKLENARR